MSSLAHLHHFTLAAIDLDGTLLGPDLTISAANRAAVARLQREGSEVVLATGRHFRSALPYARQLPGVRWIVSSQGGDVATCDRATVLAQEFLAPAAARAAIALGDRLGCTVMAYAQDGIATASTNQADLAFYARLTGFAPLRLPLAGLLQRSLHKLVWIGAPERIASLVQAPSVARLGQQTVRSHERLFEVLPHAATKGAGLETLTRHLGLAAAQAVAFGDADNDLAMFAWAGTSVAMPHGQPRARAQASCVGPDGRAEEALARAVDLILARAF